ncbi:winged helix-turn-helix domain-containing protein [Streptomyces sp. WI04-05B]|uniref:winged helix-turn-helix domain-containing protein n=1 Tax=Streptomyces TaxID=1883 RepID=UPI0029A7AEB8|nr:MULTISPECIES: winged helix-turn-helix domain-containing protein [unclassified Streptomyces]MDX2544872.1 winged helix-turn-helix domain-containing protein [Streptomyces sp. WI04-05B]MDX2588920.1 winged helix-turn-helix domain-containing protein [Streptomyces sp. WI04-05A]MDX3750773.1 winged helix-turn-helix domain-containing protein [Streptomyces sp. AK08-02]
MGEQQDSQRATEGGGREFERILAELLGRMSVTEGEPAVYALGSLLPPQRELAQEFGVSRDTVQRVLRELTREGLIDSRQGSGSRVIGVPEPGRAGGAQPGGAQPVGAVRPVGAARIAHPGRTTLAPHIREAFTKPQVTLDVYTLTSESLQGHIWLQAERIRTREIAAPRSIALRMLLPADDLPLPYPRAVGDATDTRPVDRLRAITDRHTSSLRHVLGTLRAEGLVENVEVEIRQVPIAPVFKLYLLNGTDALYGMYEVTERPIVLEDETKPLAAIDVIGIGATLMHYVRGEAGPDSGTPDSGRPDSVGPASGGPDSGGPESSGSLFVESMQSWFDSVWKYVATD